MQFKRSSYFVIILIVSEGGVTLIKIAICDDDKRICDFINDALNMYAENITERLSISVFNDGIELVSALKDDATFDIVFLDIQMNELSGVDTGNMLRDSFNHNRTNIVYVSSAKEYAMDLFHSRPLDFLVKPINNDDIFKVMDKAISLFSLDEVVYEYKIGTATHRVPVTDIIHFESKGRKVKMVTLKGEYEYYSKISDIHKKLSNHDFVLIHKSYLVNFKQIRKLAYDHVIMNNGVELKISQNYRSSVRLNQLHKGVK